MTGQDQAEKDFFTVEEAAEIIGRDSRTIRRYVKQNKLQSAGHGRVTRASVEAMAGTNLPVKVNQRGTSDMIYIEKAYVEELIFKARQGRDALDRLLEIEDSREADCAREAAMQQEIERMTAERDQARAELEAERGKSFWRRIFGK